MKRMVASVGAVVLLSSGVAFGATRGEPVSWWLPAGILFETTAPPDGFVVTDIFGATMEGDFYMRVSTDGGASWDVVLASSANPLVLPGLHLESGVVIPGDALLRATNFSGDDAPLTTNFFISGYIPCPNQCGITGAVPAVGEWGMIGLTLALVAGGAYVILKRRVNAETV